MAAIRTQLRLAFISDTLTVAVPHRDHGLALWAATATALSVLACCAFWITTGWTDGASAALFAALIGSFFAGMDDPLPAFRNFGGVILAVIAINGIYTFGVLPRITTLEMLIAALAPAFLLFGWMAARPATGRAGSWLAIFTSVQLALQSSYTGSFASFANSSIALVVGVALTGHYLRHRSPARNRLDRRPIAAKQLENARRGRRTQVARGSRRDCQSHAASPRPACRAHHRRSCRGEARRRQSSPAENGPEHHRSPAGDGLSRRTTAAIEELLARLASVFRTHAAGRLPDELVGRLDSTIASTLREPASEDRNEALIGLAGIRAGLFPEAAPYQPPERTQGECRMKYQLDLFGVIVPSLLLWSVLAYVLARAVSKVIARVGLYRQVWHPALFDFALYVCLVASLVFASKEFFS